jgi:hypothetical protein
MFIRDCGSKEEYQSRRGCLEVIERDCHLSRHDLGGSARNNLSHAKSRKVIISHSSVRPRLLPRATCTSRPVRYHRNCALRLYPIALKFGLHQFDVTRPHLLTRPPIGAVLRRRRFLSLSVVLRPFCCHGAHGCFASRVNCILKMALVRSTMARE